MSAPGFLHHQDLALAWFVAHIVVVAIVATLLRAHWVTILVAAVAAPFTALLAFLNVGLVAVLVELAARRPGRTEWDALKEAPDAKTILTSVWVRLVLLFVLLNIANVMATFMVM